MAITTVPCYDYDNDDDGDDDDDDDMCISVPCIWS